MDAADRIGVVLFALVTTTSALWFSVFQALCPPVFWVFNKIYYQFPLHLQRWWWATKRTNTKGERKRVVIVGGGFAGSTCAHVLQHHPLIDLFLVDNRGYFEFTPSVLRASVQPQHANKIQIPHEAYLNKGTVIEGLATIRSPGMLSISTCSFREAEEEENWNEEEVLLRIPGRESLLYDYLALCTGSSYSLPDFFCSSSGLNDVLFLADNFRNVSYAYTKLSSSKSVVIVGGGITGVELALEIAHVFPAISITLVHSNIFLFPEISSETVRPHQIALKVLEEHNVKVLFSERISKIEQKEENGKTFAIFYSNTSKIVADIGFLCSMGRVNRIENISESDGRIKVSSTLQVQQEGYNNVFVAGDLANTGSTLDLRLAQIAEIQAATIISNIVSLVEGNPPQAHYTSCSRPIVISLGPHNAIFVYKGWVFHGFVAGLLKEAVEWKTLCRFWK